MNYFITCFDDRWMESTRRFFDNEQSNGETGSSQCFGYYADRAKAEAAVERNACDLHECLYTWAVVEGLPEGIHPGPPHNDEFETWYQWVDGKWTRAIKPECLRQMASFSIG